MGDRLAGPGLPYGDGMAGQVVSTLSVLHMPSDALRSLANHAVAPSMSRVLHVQRRP